MKDSCRARTCICTVRGLTDSLVNAKKVLSLDLSKDVSSAKGGRNKYPPGRLGHNMTQIDSLGPTVGNDNTKVLHFHALQQKTATRINTTQACACIHTHFLSYLNLHCLRLDNMDFVLVATPDSIIHNSHAADGMVSVTEVHQVVITEIPLTI